MRFIALRELKENDGSLIPPGNPVPSAEKWPHHLQMTYVRNGYIYDLHQEMTLKDGSIAARQREAALLQRLVVDFGKSIVPCDKVPGHHMVCDDAEVLDENDDVPGAQVEKKKGRKLSKKQLAKLEAVTAGEGK